MTGDQHFGSFKMNCIKSRDEQFGKITYEPESDTFQAYSAMDQEQTLEQKLSAPLTLHWLLTMKCNARCPYCYELPFLLRPSSGEDALDESTSKKFIEDYASMGGFRLYLTGG